MMEPISPALWTFASDAERLSMLGAGCLTLALVALAMDRKRTKRRELTRVGWVPWTAVFLGLAITGGGMLAMAIPALLR